VEAFIKRLRMGSLLWLTLLFIVGCGSMQIYLGFWQKKADTAALLPDPSAGRRL
jgi:hypothetical protein